MALPSFDMLKDVECNKIEPLLQCSKCQATYQKQVALLLIDSMFFEVSLLLSFLVILITNFTWWNTCLYNASLCPSQPLTLASKRLGNLDWRRPYRFSKANMVLNFFTKSLRKKKEQDLRIQINKISSVSKNWFNYLIIDWIYIL